MRRMFNSGFVCVVVLVTAAAAPAPEKEKGVMLMNRIGPSKVGLFIANADGTGERKLLSTDTFDYGPSFSPDGRWIVFTSERDGEGTGQADIYRVHPDGKDLERLTTDSAMEDAGVLSPDGTKLVYASTKGGARTTNIWVMDLKTRKASRLTGSADNKIAETMNSYFRPSWSADGKWIAFTSDDGEKWAGAEAGAGVGHSQPLHVYIMRADGTDMRRVTNDSSVVNGSPKWSADGKTLVVYELATKDTFQARMTGTQGLANSGIISQIYRLDVASGAKTPVTTGTGLKTSPQFLPDGRIGYLVKALPRDSQEPRGVLYSDGAHGPAGVIRGPSWSPDGKLVVYFKLDIKNRPQYTSLYSWDKTRQYRYTDVFPTLCARSGKLALTDLDFPVGNPTASVSVMNPDGSERKLVFQRQDGAAMVPTWSPDCQWVAFGFGTFFGGRSARPADIRMVKWDGSETRELHAEGGLNIGFPAWSPDGKSIVYRVWGKDGEGRDQRGLRAYDVAGKTTKTLTTLWDNFPFFSPSGDRIVFTRQMPDSDFEVFSMKPDGTDQLRLTATRGADAHATWSEDGKEIWFESSRTGFKDEATLYDASPQPYAQIFLMNRDGTNVRQLTDSKWEDSMGVYLPDRRQAGGDKTALQSRE
ncbi:MAG: hypothetical protein ABI859_12405 [Pseudomonadota bacterium]